jgi:predicted transglutaminase-like protease
MNCKYIINRLKHHIFNIILVIIPQTILTCARLWARSYNQTILTCARLWARSYNQTILTCARLYSDILYNLTHFPGPLAWRIRQVLLNRLIYGLFHCGLVSIPRYSYYSYWPQPGTGQYCLIIAMGPQPGTGQYSIY